MTDAPDPLGKRALFWAPAAREDGPPGPSDRDLSGKHALFSEEARTGAILSGPGRRIAAVAANDKTRRAAAADVGRPDPLAVRPTRPAGRFLPSITVGCSSCGVTSRVDVMEFVVLHLPIWLWKPGRGYSRFMTCPACRRRTWVSASLAPRSEPHAAQDAG